MNEGITKWRNARNVEKPQNLGEAAPGRKKQPNASLNQIYSKLRYMKMERKSGKLYAPAVSVL
jgi:hypothetical protein